MISMAFYYSFKSLAYLALALVFYTQGILGSTIECENLNKDSCAFAISSAGKRCVLEHRLRRSGEEGYICRTSEIEVDKNNIYKLRDWVETDECIKACGLQRNVLGISSDSLLESLFRKKLCSAPCYHNCPNIVDLYFSLAAGEGVYLPKICELQGGKVRRGMSEIQSSGIVAAGPVTAAELLAAGPTTDEEFAVAPAVDPLY